MSSRFLLDVNGVNSFEYSAQVEIASGDTQNVYFQLIDASLDRSEQGFNPPGRRYCPAATSTLAVTFVNTDSAKQFVRAATQPFAQDPSIWTVPILGTDPLLGTVNLKIILTEPSRQLSAVFMPGVVLRVRSS